LEPLPPKARFERQRDKLTRDLGKLQKNAEELSAYLGETRLCHYWLLVPLFDWSELVAHCEKRAAILRAAKLVILDDSFTVGVQTDDAYPLERAQLIADVRALDLGVPDVSDEQRVDWAEAEENISLVADLERKLRALAIDESAQTELRTEMLGHYLAAEDMLARVRAEAPEVWHRFDNRIRARERVLATERLLDDGGPNLRLAQTVDSLTDDFLSESSRLVPGDAQAIALGTAAAWLLQCPLEF
jgi:hypothetical protein